jgi:hypothetical protein
MTTRDDCATAGDAIEPAHGARFKEGIVLGVRWLALGCILVVAK